MPGPGEWSQNEVNQEWRNDNTSKPLEIGNFDVLLEVDPSDDSLRLSHYSHHVGNNRFQVLLKMNHPQYEATLLSGTDTQVVVERIADIVCRQVIPNGRFLVRHSANWTVLSRERSLDFIRQQLDTLGGHHHLHHHNNNQHNNNNNNHHHVAIEPLSPLVPLPMRRQSQDSPLTKEDNDALLRVLEPILLEGDDIDGDKKRRRRSSLLRRSISESILMTDKKKTMRNDSLHAQFSEDEDEESNDDGLFSEEVLASVLSTSSLDQITAASPRRVRSGSLDGTRSLQITTEPLDVIFEVPGVLSSQHHMGNNRLRVLMDVQMGSYLTASPGQRDKILADLIHTVQKYWGGRFLLEDLGYMLVSDEDALSMLRASFEERAKMKKESSNPPSAASTTTSSMSHHALPGELLRHSSVPTNLGVERQTQLPAWQPDIPPASASTIHRMRNRALQALKIRKKRQESRSTLTSLTRCTSEPVRNSGANYTSNGFSDSFSSLDNGLAGVSIGGGEQSNSYEGIPEDFQSSGDPLENWLASQEGLR